MSSWTEAQWQWQYMGHSLPIISMQYHDVEIEYTLDFAKKYGGDLAQPSPITLPPLEQKQLPEDATSPEEVD
jgi:hypothetical protein